MIERRVATHYAKVLFELDKEREDLEKRVKDFRTLLALLNENPKLKQVLESPIINVEDRKQALGQLFDTKFLHFLYYLLEKGRFIYLDLIADEFRIMVDEHLGIWEVNLLTAVPIDSTNEIRLKERLEAAFQKKIQISKQVDPKIIAGAILMIDNQMLDWSVENRLKKLKENLGLGAA